VGAKARNLAVAACLALASAGAGFAQDDEEEEVADANLCGASLASSGTTSNVAYVGVQLAACDALLDAAHTASELNTAGERITQAHEQALERWHAVAEELVAAAATTAPAEGATSDPWTAKLAERHAIETGMDGLRILLRLSYQLAETYADPAALAASLEGDAAALVGDVLSSRRVCASKGMVARGNDAGTPPSWYFFADVFTDPDAPPIDHEREVRDDMALIAEAYQETALALAPSLGVSQLRSFDMKIDCPRREFPSQNPES
jgi:hypothetical protein